MTAHYPPLPSTLTTQLEAVALFMENDPSYLLNPACPYPDKLKALLKKLIGPVLTEEDLAEGSVFKAGQDGGEQIDSFMAEVQATINSMKTLAAEMATSDISDRMTFLKNYAPLLERFLSMKEKAAGLKQMFDFQAVVTSVMDEVLDKDGRLDFKNRLRQVASGG